MDGKVVVVTGASAGVGRAAVRLFAARGAHLGLIARGREGLEAAASEVRAAGRRACIAVCDVSDAEAVERAAALIEAELGPIDVWVNNAMATVMAPIKDLRPSEVKRVTEVTYLGVVHGTQAALRRMMLRDRGVIVQVGSALAYRSIPLQAAYCAAKHAAAGFTESLLCELRHDRSRVRVTTVNLPALNTPQFGWMRARTERKPQPVPPIFQPEVAARAIIWAAQNPRRELTVGWPTLKAVLAEKFVPQIADWRLAKTAYEAQQTPEPLPPGRPDNLFFPLPGDRGARGAFDSVAKAASAHLWLTTRRRWLLLPLAAAAALALRRVKGP